MVKPTKARMFAAEKSSRPVAWGIAIGDLLWEGTNKLGEHILLTWLVERLRDHEAVIVFLNCTVEHYIWFSFGLLILYLAFVCLRAMFSSDHSEEGSEPTRLTPLVSSQGPRSHAIGTINQGDNSKIIFGEDVRPAEPSPSTTPKLNVHEFGVSFEGLPIRSIDKGHDAFTIHPAGADSFITLTDHTKVVRAPESENAAITMDRNMLSALQAVLPSIAIAELKVQQFRASVTWKSDSVLTSFYQWGLKSENRFLDHALEQIHAHLREVVNDLLFTLHRDTKLVSREGEVQFLAFEPVERSDDAKKDRQEKVWQKATEACATYDKLIDAARRTFAGLPVVQPVSDLPLTNIAEWPRVILSYQRSSKYGFHVANHNPQVEARAVELKPARSPHYSLRSERIGLLTAGTPALPLVLRAELIEGTGEDRLQEAEGQEAWDTVAKDLWLKRQSKTTMEDSDPLAVINRLGNAMVRDLNDGTSLVIALNVVYTDLAGTGYVSPADVEWCIVGGVIEVRPGVISKVTHAAN
jgi:hypothetical protein